MPSPVQVFTRPITRDKIARLGLGVSHELIKLLEGLTTDVGTTLPTAVADNSNAIDEASAEAALAIGLAAAAQGLAQLALAVVNEGPPPAVLPAIPTGDDITPPWAAQVLARLAELERAVSNLREGPTP